MCKQGSRKEAKLFFNEQNQQNFRSQLMFDKQ